MPINIAIDGPAGAGKSTALKILEDTGYYCVDNLPVELVPKLGELLLLPGSSISRIALGLDIRSGHSFEKLRKICWSKLDEMKISYEIPFSGSFGRDFDQTLQRDKAQSSACGKRQSRSGHYRREKKTGVLKKKGRLSDRYQPSSDKRAAGRNA